MHLSPLLTTLLKKALAFLLGLLLLSMAVFALQYHAPGDPLRAYYGDRVEKMSPADRETALARLGLDEPMHKQYLRWLGNALRGDLGLSYKYKQPVGEVILSRAGNTLILGGLGFMIIFFGALALGVLCARRENGLLDRTLGRIGTVLSCIPEFWISLLLMLVFSVTLRWLPASGAYSTGGRTDIADRLMHLILPLTVVVISHLWYFAYMVRTRLLEELTAEYVRTAQAKGLRERAILYRHCLRNILPAYLTLMAINLPHILGGTYVVETVFSYPGLGTLAYESARTQDYNLLMVLCLLTGAITMLSSALGQLLSARIDPRLHADAQDVSAEQEAAK